MLEDIGKYYIYRHVRLDNNEVFYIGVGTKTSNKNIVTKTETYKEIYKRAYVQSTRNSFWKSIVSKTKYRVDILCESNDYSFIEEKEKEFIKLYGRRDLKTGTLVNFTDGGKGQNNAIRKPLSEETKQKMSLAQKGKPKSEEHKKSLSLAKQNNPPEYWKGKTFSEEHKEKLRKPKNRIIGNTFKGKSNIKNKNNHQKRYLIIRNGQEQIVFMNKKQLYLYLNISHRTLDRILKGENTPTIPIKIYEQ